jgi:integral membrane protein (TIGR00529 family)
LLTFLNPLIVFMGSIGVFLLLLYRKVGLGIALTCSALLLSLLSLGISQTANVLLETLVDPISLSLVFASFFIMLMSVFYKETGMVNDLTRSLGRYIKNSKIIVSLLPAVIGLMPVAGGALMSAPMVDAEAEKLELDNAKKAFVNIWFRHVVIPVYPVTQFIVLTAALTQTSLDALITRQILVVLVMVVIGYYIGLRKTKETKQKNINIKKDPKTNLKVLFISILPIIVTVLLTTALDVDIAFATLAGVIVILVVTKKKIDFLKILKNKTIWEVTLAAFGAMLFKNVTITSGASEIFGGLLANTNMPAIVMLSFVPAVLAFLIGSTSGAIALSIPILAETIEFIPKNVSLIFISSYLGYMIAPTHLCLVFTAHYFKSSISSSFKYLIPATFVSMAAALITYLIL